MYDHTKYNHPDDFSKMFHPFEPNYGWTYFVEVEHPKQTDGYNCGVFALAFARTLSQGCNPRLIITHQVQDY